MDLKQTAVLLDLAFVLQKLYPLLGERLATADEVHEFAQRCVAEENEELFRIYCYDAWPYGKVETHPVTKEQEDFSTTPTYTNKMDLLKALSLKDKVAFRAGELSFDGWKIKRWSIPPIIKQSRGIKAEDFQPDLKQKRVDMKIGLDVAWLSSKNIVDRLILVTADSDFVPAMKFARREGIQIVLVTMDHKQVKYDLRVHADELRSVTYPC